MQYNKLHTLINRIKTLNFSTTKTRLYVMGDTHTSLDWQRFYQAYLDDDEDDDIQKYFIFLGDSFDPVFKTDEKDFVDRSMKNVKLIFNYLITNKNTFYIMGNHELTRIGLKYFNAYEYTSPKINNLVLLKEHNFDNPDYVRTVQAVSNILKTGKVRLAMIFGNFLLSHAGVRAGHYNVYKPNQKIDEHYLAENFDSLMQDYELQNNNPFTQHFLKNYTHVIGHFPVSRYCSRPSFPLYLHKNVIDIDDSYTNRDGKLRGLIIDIGESPDENNIRVFG